MAGEPQDAAIFGATLRELRQAAGLTQERLAGVAGLTTSFVNNLERGVKVPSLTSIVKLARALEVDPGALLVGFAGKSRRR